MRIASIKLFAMLALLSSFAFVQCKSSSSSTKVNMKKPESVSLAFVRSLSQLDIAKTKELCTPEAKELMSMMEGVMGMISEEEKTKLQAEAKESLKLLKTSTCKVTGETAQCTVCCEPNGSASDKPLTLKKIDGKWYVHFTKEDLNLGGEGGGMDGMGGE